MGIRANILTNTTARDQYIEGVTRLKNEFTGPTTASLGVPGPSRQISTYDALRGVASCGHDDLYSGLPEGS